jgi:hypothetical protein
MLTYADVCDAWPPGMYATKRFLFFFHTFESPEIESEFLESHASINRLRCVCVCVCVCVCLESKSRSFGSGSSKKKKKSAD